MRKIDVYMYDTLPRTLKTIISRKESEWQNWTDAQIATWFYTAMGEKYSMDQNYLCADSARKLQIELEAEDFRNFERRLSKRNVTCIDMAKALEVVLNDVFGIRCKAVVDGSGPHQYNIINIGKKIIKADLQEDLVNIQSGRRLEKFGQTDYYDGRNFSVLDNDELDNLLLSIGYKGIPYKNNELDIYAESLKNKDQPLHEKLEIILLAVNSKYSEQLFKMEYYERTELFKQCILDCLCRDENEIRKFKNFNQDSEISHRTARVKNNFVSCFSVKTSDGSLKYYINDGTKLRYEEIDEKTYDNMFNKPKETESTIIV